MPFSAWHWSGYIGRTVVAALWFFSSDGLLGVGNRSSGMDVDRNNTQNSFRKFALVPWLFTHLNYNTAAYSSLACVIGPKAWVALSLQSCEFNYGFSAHNWLPDEEFPLSLRYGWVCFSSWFYTFLFFPAFNTNPLYFPRLSNFLGHSTFKEMTK